MKSRSLAFLLALLLALVPLCGCNRLAEALLAPAPAQTQSQSQQSPAPELFADLPLLTAAPEGEGVPAPEEEIPVQNDAALAEPEQSPAALDEGGAYTTRDDVALYLSLYGRLPDNFITKSAARELGWSGGGLDDYAYGKCIGGDRFGNYEGLLPEKRGRSYYECDIGTLHKSSRGAKRIVFSSDGLIYYTDDHYESFTLLYGEES